MSLLLVIKTDKDQILVALKNLELEHDEAYIYYLLVRLGSANVGKISTLSEFSRTKIYTILDKLLAKVWIKVISDKPKTFVPIDPDKILFARKKVIMESYKTAVDTLSPMYEKSKLEISETITFRGLSVLKKLKEMLSIAKNEIDIVTAFIPQKWIEKMADMLENARSNGVIIKTFVSAEFKNNIFIKKYEKKFNVCFGKIPNAGLLIIDNDEILFAGIESESTEPIPTNLLGIWTKNKAIIKLSKMIFNQMHSGNIIR